MAVIDAIGSSHGGGKWKEMVLVDDRIADSIFQQIQTRPQEYSILATLNLNGDYISDAAAAMVGGLGMAPGHRRERPPAPTSAKKPPSSEASPRHRDREHTSGDFYEHLWDDVRPRSRSLPIV